MYWRTYTVVIGLLSFWGYMATGMPRIWELVDFLTFIVGYAGVVSFAWGMQLFRRWFWRMWFVITVVWNVIYLFFIPAYGADAVSGWIQGVNTGLSILIYLPMFIALFLYAFRKQSVW